MVFLDLDNTMIPTRLHQVLSGTFGIDIYSTFTASLFAKLEENIISAITKIKETIENDNHRVVMAVVSNANIPWIQQCLDVDVLCKSDGPIKLSKLCTCSLSIQLLAL